MERDLHKEKDCSDGYHWSYRKLGERHGPGYSLHLSVGTKTNTTLVWGFWPLRQWAYKLLLFLSFNLFMWYITLIDLCILKNPCIPGKNPTWSWCISFWCVAEFCSLEFCWGFLHLCSSVILVCSYLFLCCLCLILVSGWWWPDRMSLEVFFPLKLFVRVLEG